MGDGWTMVLASPVATLPGVMIAGPDGPVRPGTESPRPHTPFGAFVA